MTIKEVAEMMEVSPGLVYGLCSRGELAHYRVGRGRGTIRVAEADARAFLEAARVEALPPGARPVTPPRRPHSPPPDRSGRSPVRLLDAVAARRASSKPG